MKIATIIGGMGRNEKIWTDEFIAEIERRGELTFFAAGHQPIPPDEGADMIRPFEVALVGWDSHGLSPLLAADPGELRYVCCYSGTVRFFAPRELVEAGIMVSNWGDLPAAPVAEGAMTLLLSMLHEIPPALDAKRAGGWGFDSDRRGLLRDLAVGVYGCGVIGLRFIEMLRPFEARVKVFDPYLAELPEGCTRADSLDELCEWAEALVIHAGWSEETEGSVTAQHLAKLPDGGVFVNTARGAIVDQHALFAELESGRLRAGLDVLHPEALDPDHPIRQLPNVILTFHDASNDDWPVRPGLTRQHRRVLEQLDRYAAGETPHYLFDVDRWDRST